MEALTYRPEVEPLIYGPESSAETEDSNEDVAYNTDSVEDVEVDIDTPIASEHGYPQRDRHAPSFFTPGSAKISDAFAGIDDALPDRSSIHEALEREDAVKWKEAIESELESPRKHGTWEAVSQQERVKPLSTKFFFLRKCDEKGIVILRKPRLVFRGFLHGDVDQNFAPVADFSTVRTALAVALQKGNVIQQLDVRKAFLHGEIHSDIYVKPPARVKVCRLDQVLKLRRSLYSPKQSHASGMRSRIRS